ncbi:MAG: hypothetical protein DMF52_14670 [Acidobacteria bacterium]|nr:MAG: hypothetical protein DMF52_14670 [Acidobacteriota bacterium]
MRSAVASTEAVRARRDPGGGILSFYQQPRLRPRLLTPLIYSGRRRDSLEEIKQAVARALETLLREKYAAGPEMISVEYPPQPGMGDLASPVAFEMAKRLRRAPRQIAQELAAAFPALPGVVRVEAGGAGYLNIFLSALLRASGRGAELHRRHGRAGRGHRHRLPRDPAPGHERGAGGPGEVRLFLLGPVRARHGDVRAAAREAAAQDRGPQAPGGARGGRRDACGVRGAPHRRLPPRYDGTHRSALRPPSLGERYPRAPLLGAGVRSAEKEPGDRTGDVGRSERLLGHGAGGAALRGSQGRREDHRAQQRHRDLCRQGHRLPALEVRPARCRLRLRAIPGRTGRPRRLDHHR